MTAVEEDGDDERLVGLEPADGWFNSLKPMVLHHQILFSRTTAATAEAIPMQTSAEQVPSLHRAASRSPPLTSGRSCQCPH